MNTYTPRVGDKVRATLGESVLFGVVDDLGEPPWTPGFWLIIDGLSRNEWTFIQSGLWDVVLFDGVDE